MKDNRKSSKLGIILSVIAVIIALIPFVFSRVKGRPSWIILFCALSIFFSNIAIYKSHKSKDTNSKKNI